jgi:hypothetical protein
MHVVVDSDVLKDAREADLNRHLDMLSRCVERARAIGAPSPSITMILRTADSPPALILAHMTDTLRRAGAGARAILARLEPEEDLRRLVSSLSELSPSEPAQALIRWARNPRLLDAHEQATYGEDMCWSGDAMRRESDRRNVLALFNEGVPDRMRLGRLAFEALWAISSPVPDRHLNGRAAAKPAGAFQPSQKTPVAVSPLRPSLQAWPLIRH